MLTNVTGEAAVNEDTTTIDEADVGAPVDPPDAVNSIAPPADATAVGAAPADDNPEPLGDADPADAPHDTLVAEVGWLRDEITRKDRECRALFKRDQREESLKPYQVELLKLQRHLEHTDQRMIVLFEGRDAAGKGGTIRRVTRYMNEKHYRVVALGKPTDEQRTQWYLQRYVTQFPRGGEMVLFDRSWYNRAMVEPVFGFCTQKEYEDFLRGVVGFEKDLVRQGTALVKLYFSVSKEEQQRRFERRRDDPLRQWKLSEIDMQAQEHWDDFTTHKYEMLRRSHTSHTPWTVIRSENKRKARLNAMKVILNAVDYEDRNPDLDFVPSPKVVLSGAHEVELMEADRLRRGKFQR
ncbi:MAG: polyphosphate kinase 2 [Microthrixaceae bacterium]